MFRETERSERERERARERVGGEEETSIILSFVTVRSINPHHEHCLMQPSLYYKQEGKNNLRSNQRDGNLKAPTVLWQPW